MMRETATWTWAQTRSAVVAQCAHTTRNRAAGNCNNEGCVFLASLHPENWARIHGNPRAFRQFRPLRPRCLPPSPPTPSSPPPAPGAFCLKCIQFWDGTDTRAKGAKRDQCKRRSRRKTIWRLWQCFCSQLQFHRCGCITYFLNKGEISNAVSINASCHKMHIHNIYVKQFSRNMHSIACMARSSPRGGPLDSKFDQKTRFKCERSDSEATKSIIVGNGQRFLRATNK